MAFLDKSVADFRDLQARVRELIGGVGVAFDTPGYLYGGAVYYTSSGTFDKGDYPGLRAVMVEMVGGGGGGGGAATTGANQASAGAGAGAGAYARAFVLESDLASSEAVTVGAGGDGAVGTTTAATAGADSVFDTISGEVRADGGSAGATSTAGTGSLGFAGAAGGSVANSSGDLVIEGGAGQMGRRFGNPCFITNFGYGGDSMFGQGGRPPNSNTGGSGGAGQGYGSGGGAGYNYENQGTARHGGDGAPGIVIVHLYY